MRPIIPVLMVLVSLQVGCAGLKSEDGADELVRRCADSDLAGSSVLYFGPSNQIGPGSVWSRLTPSGGYQPEWRLQDLSIGSKDVIQEGASFQCDLSSSSVLAANAALSVISAVANASAEAKADFSRSKVVKVTTTGAAWDTVIGGPYKARVDAIPNSATRNDVKGPNRLVLRRALRVNGYKVVLDFDNSIKPSIKGKYDGVKLGKDKVGDVGAELSASWTSDNKLELTGSDGIYLAGEFAQLVNGELVGSRGARSIPDLQDKYVRPYKAR